MDFEKRLSNYEDEMKAVAEKYRPLFKQLIEKHSCELWGFKEASLIYYLPYLHNELENPCYIHLIRNYESTANSHLDMVSSRYWKENYNEKMHFLSFRKKIRLLLRIFRLLFTTISKRNKENFVKVVENAHKRIDSFLENKLHLKIYLDKLKESPIEEINKLTNFLEIIPTDTQLQDAIDFIHPELLTK